MRYLQTDLFAPRYLELFTALEAAAAFGDAAHTHLNRIAKDYRELTRQPTPVTDEGGGG